MKVKGVIANPPSDRTLLAGGTGLIGLAVDTQVHNVIAANGAVVDYNVPSPQRDCIPLLDLKLLLSVCCVAAAGTGFGLLGGCVGHFYIGHGSWWFRGVREGTRVSVLMRVECISVFRWRMGSVAGMEGNYLM